MNEKEHAAVVSSPPVQLQFPLVRFVARHGFYTCVAVFAALLCLASLHMYVGGAASVVASWGAAIIAGTLASRLAVELIQLIADMLLPR